MVTIDNGLFIALIIFAVIGAIVVAIIILYFFAYILDITYYERNPSEQEKKCPYEIERKEEDRK